MLEIYINEYIHLSVFTYIYIYECYLNIKNYIILMKVPAPKKSFYRNMYLSQQLYVPGKSKRFLYNSKFKKK